MKFGVSQKNTRKTKVESITQ